MPDILIRNVPAATVARLKQRARKSGRSLQAEALAALEAATPHSGDTFVDEIEQLQAGGKLTFDVHAVLDALFEDRAR